jgi:dTDP-4-amino-4,6-dideoxygalactose transaminase
MIRLSKSNITESEKKAVMGVLDREYLGMGQEVQQFEERLSEFFARPATCVVNGTAALHLACQAVGLKTGDEVLVPSLTYVSSFQAISATGAKPVACDIDPKTLTINWRDAEKRLTDNTKVIMPVHYGGGVGDIEGIYSFARQYGLRVIEDAAHAFGSTHKGLRVGGFGDISCFSFDGIKNITSGEGGCIVTNDQLVIAKIRDARLLGVEHDTSRRYSGERSWDFDVSAQGWRYHMSNIMAAIGLEQLKRFSDLSLKRQLLARRYDKLLINNAVFSPIEHDYANVVPHIYVVIINGLVDCNVLRERMANVGIQTGIHYKPNHLLSLYEAINTPPLTVTESIYPMLITLPLHPSMSESDVDFVCNKLCSYVH